MDVYNRFVKAYKDMNEKIGKRAVSGSISDVLPPGFHLEGSSGACRIFEGSGIYAGAGAGFLSDTFHDLNLYVLYRTVDPRTMEPVYVRDQSA